MMTPKEVYQLWANNVRDFDGSIIGYDNISPSVKPKLETAFKKIQENVPEYLLIPYFQYVTSYCHKLKIRPTYVIASSDKMISSYVKTQKVCRGAQYKATLERSKNEWDKFIKEVEKFRAEGYGVLSACSIVLDLFSWQDKEKIEKKAYEYCKSVKESV